MEMVFLFCCTYFSRRAAWENVNCWEKCEYVSWGMSVKNVSQISVKIPPDKKKHEEGGQEH